MNLIKTTQDRFLAIDANAIVHRAFHAYPSTLQTDDGVQVNAVYGFTVMLLSALKTFEPKYILCAFDTPKPTFRHTEYTDYKGTRKPTDQSLIDQFPLVEEVLKAFNIPILKREGFEADDILGTISKYIEDGKWSTENLELYILSGDRDLLQLIKDGKTKVCLPAGNFKNLIAYDEEKTFQTFGYHPYQVIDYKAVVGDASDNIPGIKGIGDKTVLELLSKYDNLDNIYKNIDALTPRQKTLFTEGIEQAEMSRRLATIERNVGINILLENCLSKDFDRSQVLNIFKKFSFKSLLPRVEEIFGKEERTQSAQLDIFSTGKNLVFKKGNKEDFIRFSKESSSMTIAYVEETESATEEQFVLARSRKNNEQEDLIFDPKDLFETEIICPITIYNLENLPYKPKIENEKTFDICLFGHMINSERNKLTLKDLTFDYAGQILGDKILMSECTRILDFVEEIKEIEIKNANEIELYEYTKNSIKSALNVNEEYLLNVLRKIDIPISFILSTMENRGIVVDKEYLEKLDKELELKLEELTKEIYSIVGHEFNINSPKQLSDVMFKELNLPPVKNLSTKESVLTSFLGIHPCIEKLLEYRELSKIHNTYTKPLLEMARGDLEGAIHTDFKQTGTTSGRFSSVNPNMQNIPAQGPWAEKLRRAFIPREGFKFVGMDYSQIELRIMADVSGDPLLIKDFVDDKDIHRATAARVLKKEMSEVTKEERSLGKTVNFAILFGQTPFGLAKLLKIDADIAKEYIQNYFTNYIGVETYIRSLEKEAYKRGFVQSMFGTTRRISAIKSKNIRSRNAAQREAVNMPIQGSEADIMKLAMVKLATLIDSKYSGKAYMLLQVHDELVFEVSKDCVNDFEQEVLNLLRNVVNLNVPLDVHSSIGGKLSELK